MSEELPKIVPVGPIGAPKSPCECLADIAELMDDLADLDTIDDVDKLREIMRDNENREIGCPVIYGHGTKTLEDMLNIATTKVSMKPAMGITSRLRRSGKDLKALLPMEWLTAIILSIEGEGSSMTMDDDEEREEVIEDIQKQPYLWMASDTIPRECVNKMMDIFQEEDDVFEFDIMSMDDLEVVDRRRKGLMEKVDDFFDYCEPTKPVLPTLEGMDKKLDTVDEAIMEYRSELDMLEKDENELTYLQNYQGMEFDEDRKESVYKLETEGGDTLTYTRLELEDALTDIEHRINRLINIIDVEYVDEMRGMEKNYLSGLKIMVETAMWPNCKNLRWKKR